jgi:hypothetical protein
VTISIQNLSGLEVAADTIMPTVNVGGDVGNKFLKFSLQKFEFDITEADDYVIVFYPDAARDADFVLGYLSLQALEYGTTDIINVTAPVSTSHSQVYDLSGRQIPEGKLKRGFYIIDGRKTFVP